MPRRWHVILAAILTLDVPLSPPGLAQLTPTPVQVAPGTNQFDMQQLDALLAPVALYPDQLLTQLLIAATFPLQIVEASRWIEDPAHKDLKGDALAKALEPLPWDPSVKSLVPFPQVLSQMNNNLEWTQQLGYAFANQQKDVLDSVQRLRREAQAQGHLESTPQQIVRTEGQAGAGAPQTVVIEPAQPNVVYVPSYSPSTVYGAWPYPAYPPVAATPGPEYVAGTALLSGLAFGTGIAISSALWGWSSPNWSNGNVNVNVDHWNTINVNRQPAVSNTWSPAWNRAGWQAATLQRPPAGPVGPPVRNAGLPAHAIGRSNVGVADNLVNRPALPNQGASNPVSHLNLSPGSRPRPTVQRTVQRPHSGGQGQRSRPDALHMPGGGLARQPGGSGQRMHSQKVQIQRPGSGAFGGIGEGGRATAFAQRGAQSRQSGGLRVQQPSGGARGGGGNVRGGSHDRK
jgi:hypothetical protein